MSIQTWQELIGVGQSDGSTLTAAAAASMLPGPAKIVLPANFFDRVGKAVKINATGRITNVVTTPGTARYDVRLGGTVVFDTNAMPLNIVAKTNVGWWLEVMLTCRAVGTTGNLFGQGLWQSESYIGSPAATAGGNGSIMLPYNAAPAVGANFDTTIAQTFDMFFTQTVATGSMTLHQIWVNAGN
jgi:hypothetical protein